MPDEQASLAFLQSQAAYIEQAAYQIRYADIQYPRLATVVTDTPPWAGQITYYSTDGTGRMEFLAQAGNDFPTVEVKSAQHDVRIESLGIGYDYTYEELQYAMRLGVDLNPMRAQLARRVAEEKIDTIFQDGVADMGWDGFLNYSSAPRKTAPNGSAGSSDWPSKTGMEVLSDIQGAIGDIWSDTRQVRIADTIALSPKRYEYLATTYLGDNADKTIMTFLMANNIYTSTTGNPLRITTLRQLDTAGSGSTQRMIAYQNTEDVLRFHIPMPLQFFTAQQDMMMFRVPAICRCAGLEIRQPQAFRYVDGI